MLLRYAWGRRNGLQFPPVKPLCYLTEIRLPTSCAFSDPSTYFPGAPGFLGFPYRSNPAIKHPFNRGGRIAYT